MSTPLTINSVETLQEALPLIRASQEAYSNFTQEQVDAICEKTAMAVSKMRIPLAKMACEETGYGIVVDKVTKNQYASEHIWNYMRNKKTCGIISEDRAFGVKKIASPKGVIAAITPTTNPTSTTIYKIMLALKTRNAIILSPHPHAVNCSIAAAKIMRDAAIEAGLPEHVISWISVPSLEISDVLMKSVDLIIATGGSGMVKAAYSSGTPAYGVGPGNPPVVLDRGYDLEDAAKKTVVAVGSDNGILCDGDNLLLYPQESEEAFFEALKQEGVVLFEEKKDVEEFGKVLFVNGKANPEMVGKDAPVIAEAAGFSIPKDTKVVGLKIDAVGRANILNKEIMGPIVVLKSYETFEEATAMAVQNMEEAGGIGHTAGIFSNDKKHIDYYAERIPVARVLVNQPTPDAWGPSTNGLSPAVSESCGTWGNNILCENVDYIHLINVSKIALPLDVELPSGEELFAD